MKIAVNTRLLIKNKLEGIGWFTYEVLKRITQQHPEHQFIFIFDRPYDNSFIFSDNVTAEVAGPQARHPFLFYWWFEKSIPKILKKHNVDLFFSPDGYLSLKTKVKSVAAIHDLNFEHYPGQIPVVARKHYRHFFPRFARKADKVVTVSQYSKDDIVKQYAIRPDKIDVVYNGASSLFKPLKEEEKIQIRAKYANGDHYFVYIGSINPRKNVKNLLWAFEQFREGNPELSFKLLIVGETMWRDGQIGEILTTLKFKSDILFIGRTGQVDLTKILGAAFALTYVSLFEGFGIPLVEAMSCEVPIITSNVTSMPEIAGEAAILVNPEKPKEIAEAMSQMVKNEELRKQLVEKGKIRSRKFSWDSTAEKVWNSLITT